MRRAAPLLILIAITLGAGVAVAVGGAAGAPPAASKGAGGPSVLGSEIGAKTFSVRGDVTGLRPGGTSPLVVTIDNPNPFTISVTTLTVQVGAAGARCPAQNLQVDPLRSPVAVPGRGSATTTLAAHLAPAAPDACQGVSFPLTYAATAVKP